MYLVSPEASAQDWKQFVIQNFSIVDKIMFQILSIDDIKVTIYLMLRDNMIALMFNF